MASREGEASELEAVRGEANQLRSNLAAVQQQLTAQQQQQEADLAAAAAERDALNVQLAAAQKKVAAQDARLVELTSAVQAQQGVQVSLEADSLVNRLCCVPNHLSAHRMKGRRRNATL